MAKRLHTIHAYETQRIVNDAKQHKWFLFMDENSSVIVNNVVTAVAVCCSFFAIVCAALPIKNVLFVNIASNALGEMDEKEKILYTYLSTFQTEERCSRIESERKIKKSRTSKQPKRKEDERKNYVLLGGAIKLN